MLGCVVSYEEQTRWYMDRGRCFVEHLMPTLRGKSVVWHRTAIMGLQGIVSSQAILPSDPNTHPSRNPGCAADKLHMVPLFDFDVPSLDQIYWAAGNDWEGFLNPHLGEQGPVVLLRVPVERLDGSRLKRQTDPDIAEYLRTNLDHRKILHVEAWHDGPIPWGSIDAALAVHQAYGAETQFVPLDLSNAIADAERLGELWDVEYETARQADIEKDPEALRITPGFYRGGNL